MGDDTIRALAPGTWDAFARLVEQHNGVFGGCWCIWFHPMCAERGQGYEGNRALKRHLVDQGRAHAALVFDGDAAVAWCEYGTPEELPRIHHRKQYEAELVTPPDQRITCIFVDRDHRRRGTAAIAVSGALQLIAQAGGGLVEAYPQDTPPKVPAAFLYSGTRSLFERAGFAYDRPKGANNCMMSKTAEPA